MLAPVVGGMAGLAYTATVFASAWRARSWPSVAGEIAATRLVRRETTSGGENDASTERDYPYVAYRYTVAGQPYRNDRVVFGPVVAPRSMLPGVDPEPDAPDAAARLAAEFPRGKSVRVHYNPQDPADSVLYPSVARSIWVIAGVAVAVIWLGVRQR